jgi:type VI secretion system secreted protein Hcp
MPIYMKYDGIKGTVVRNKEKWIELQSAQFGSTRNISSPSGRGVNREATAPAIQEITVTKLQDSTSTDLFKEAVWGKGKKVVIHFVESDPPGAKKGGLPVTEKDAHLIVELENVLISSFTASGAGGDSLSVPTESMSLNFTKAKFTAPSVGAWHDLATP